MMKVKLIFFQKEKVTKDKKNSNQEVLKKIIDGK